MGVESEQSRTIEASVSADLAIHAMIEGSIPPHLVAIQHGGSLPKLPMVNINLYVSDTTKGPVIDHLATLVRQSFAPRNVLAMA